MKLHQMLIAGKGSFATVYACHYDGKPHAVKHFENVAALTSRELLVVKREA